MEQQQLKADAAHQEAVWVMVILSGLLLAPFLPASNILFYVGTFIGERLLYLPSAGFCLVLSHLTVKYLDPSELPMWRHVMQRLDLVTASEGPFHSMQQEDASATVQEVVSRQALPASGEEPNILQQEEQLQQPVSEQEPCFKTQKPAFNQLQQQQQQQQQQQCDTRHRPDKGRLRSWLGLSLVCLLLVGYSWRTVSRNWDWHDEETLFIAAQKVTHKLPSWLSCLAAFSVGSGSSLQLPHRVRL